MEHYLYSNYTPVGDILVVTACLLFLVLMHIAYITKTRTYTIFRLLIFTLILAVVKIICFFSICKGEAKEPPIVRAFGFLR